MTKQNTLSRMAMPAADELCAAIMKAERASAFSSFADLGNFETAIQPFPEVIYYVPSTPSHMSPPIPSRNTTVLIVDDDPLHLSLYTWILETDGYKCATALVEGTTVELPTGSAVDLVLLDYRLNSALTPVDVAQKLRSAFPSAPIVILSELPWMPDDVRGHAATFVNKGDPTLLLETIGAIVRGESL